MILVTQWKSIINGSALPVRSIAFSFNFTCSHTLIHSWLLLFILSDTGHFHDFRVDIETVCCKGCVLAPTVVRFQLKKFQVWCLLRKHCL